MLGGPSSKSLLSPGRGRDPPVAAPSLSASLSRRLRSSGSVKGAQSPMFPAVVATAGGGRRKGCVLETTEPSSPKVTCIGQVRVKTKKRKKQVATAAAVRSRSRRVGSRGEASFRISEEFGRGKEGFSNKNQRWTYQLPMSICEALKAIGSEFSCFFPCGGRSFCSNSSRSAYEQEAEQCGGREKQSASSSCGAVIVRWLRAIQDGEEEGKREEMVSLVVERRKDREMEVYIKDRVEKEEVESEKKDGLVVNDKKRGEEEEVEDARVSICVPPPNALLLMRCRSDPVRMAALATRFWDSPAMKILVEKEVVEEDQEEIKGSCDDDMLEYEVEGGVRAEDVTRPGVVFETAEQVDQKENDVEQSTQGIGLADELESWKEGKEEKENELVRKQSCCEEDLTDHLDQDGSSASSPEMHGNQSLDQEVEAAAEAEKLELDCIETRKMGNEVLSVVKEVEKEEGEVKGRRSSSCSSSMDREVRKSSKCQPRATEGGRRRGSASRERGRRWHSFSAESKVRRPSFSNEREARRASFSIEGMRRWSFCIEAEDLKLEKIALDEEKQKEQESSADGKELKDTSEAQNSKTTEEQTTAVQEESEAETADAVDSQGGWTRAEELNEEKRGNELPDCLLLMMNEPKLSMELSKETWVCSTDFLRWHPHRSHYRKRGGELAKIKAEAEDKGNENDDGKEKEAANAPVKQVQKHPPSEPPISTIMEKKLMANTASVKAPNPSLSIPYGPFILTRCKSEPMRSSARLAPDTCFWRDRHRPIGATGIGF